MAGEKLHLSGLDDNSTFQVVAPLTQTGLNAENLPIAESVIANNDLEITLRQEMLDTVVGTPMGTTPASSAGTVAFINSSRYVLKQTCTIRNISGAATVLGVAVGAILEALTANARVLKEPAPPIFIARLAESVRIGVGPWVNVAEYVPAAGEINRAILERFRERGIVIPKPQREEHLVGKSA